MTEPDDDLLTTTEGVDEGSAASTAEDRSSGSAPGAGARPDVPDAEPVAPPVDMDTDDPAAQRGPGQQLEVGEG